MIGGLSVCDENVFHALFHRFLIKYFFMRCMLVDDEQLVLILYHPVSIEQLSDDLVFLLGIFVRNPSETAASSCCS